MFQSFHDENNILMLMVGGVRFVRDNHDVWDLYSATSLKERFIGTFVYRHVSLLGHLISLRASESLVLLPDNASSQQQGSNKC